MHHDPSSKSTPNKQDHSLETARKSDLEIQKPVGGKIRNGKMYAKQRRWTWYLTYHQAVANPLGIKIRSKNRVK
jgi:hypothetical protein